MLGTPVHFAARSPSSAIRSASGTANRARSLLLEVLGQSRE